MYDSNFSQGPAKKTLFSALDQLPCQLMELGFGEIHLKYDPATELLAIIAIHNDKFIPSIGGCRCIEYSSFAEAMQDALRLARGMSFKTAISNLAWGGAKAVLLKPKQIKDRVAYYQAFGRFVHELGGRYVTSIDSGTLLTDLETIAEVTPYVSGLAKHYGDNSDPSLATAIGVRHGIEAAVKFKLAKDSLAGLTFAIQGVGHVGYHLCEQLHQRGAKLIVADSNPAHATRCQTEFGAHVVAPNDIFAIDCDVFVPCALGGILNQQTLALLAGKIVAGSANNQLADNHCGELLQQYDIVYAPDFVINAGGVILATALYEQRPLVEALRQLEHIYDVLMAIFAQSHDQGLATYRVAEQMVEARLR